ncbi:Acyl-CoA ligase AFT1-1 [Fusarium oxysporum f. sp. cubense]|uniref:Acyl-CoA ligase AFT1-1 n=1 Tax=Fusarium oxysporum f. sp. cubense TaxID=61366 RepID=A0A559KRW8_FUSOC|nr:Acyl-CoA ligase AFT1-1 [Fusarium oxysporum f. sp. cubense]
MVFTTPEWVPKLPFDPPDSITIAEFVNNETYGRYPVAKARNPFTCGFTGKTYSMAEVLQREEFMARAIAKRLGYDLSKGTEWDRVVCLFSLNTVDYIPFTHAIHRLSSIVTPASAAYSAPELEHQLQSSGANALFTCVPLLKTALAAAKAAGIPEERIYILPMSGDKQVPFQTIDDLVLEGETLPELPPLVFTPGQGARQVAYLCYSSGTSGLPKATMISHHNVISNIMMVRLYNQVGRTTAKVETQATLGLLPFSHVYGLVVCGLYALVAGDELVVLPRFELKTFLEVIQKFRIEQIAIVPPILIQMLNNQDLCSEYDLSSVRFVLSGAAPLGVETMQDILKVYPNWHLCQGYGLTETSPVVTFTSELDILPGSSGSLLPGLRAKIIDATGKEVTGYETPGEMLVQGPTVVLGYLNNINSTASTFIYDEDGRWMKTGDEVIVRKSPKGTEHFIVTDRIKELIKVKGHQVAPAELEAHLLSHPLVSDCAVIQVPNAKAGEVPKAFVVKAAEAGGMSDGDVTASIHKHVEDHKARHKWLKGGIEFIKVIPKSPTGKILRRLLRDQEKQARKAKGPKL